VSESRSTSCYIIQTVWLQLLRSCRKVTLLAARLMACVVTRFDCILLDIMMVRTNGVDVALTLRGAFEGSPTPLPPLVAMTANTSAREAQMCVCALPPAHDESL
jgi:CheY-like chemotaxis protein